MANTSARDTKYKTEYCSELVEHMAAGGSIRGFAGKVRVSSRTLYDWFEKYPDFKRARDVGSNASFHWWEEQGRLGVWEITEYDENGKPSLRKKLNAPVWIANMNNRFKWRHEPQVEVEINNNASQADKVAKDVFDEIKKLLLGYANERKAG